MKVYGIKSCDMIKKTKDWLEDHSLEYDFHDYKSEGISAEKLKTWIQKAGLDKVMNKRSTTWKELGEKEQNKIKTEADAIKVMQEHTSMIKRPIIESGDVLLVGFDAKEMEKLTKST